MFGMPPALMLIVGLVLAAIGLFGGYMATTAFGLLLAEQTEPKLSFQKLAIFCIELEKDIYQFGAVVHLFNLDNKPYLIERVSFFRTDLQIISRGGYNITGWLQNEPLAQIAEDNFIKANSDGLYKIILPTKLEMTIQGSPPALLFFGNWQAILKEKVAIIKPDRIGAYNKVISLGEWNGILKQGSSVNLDSIEYMRMPEKIASPGKLSYYLIYNAHRSASFNVYGFDAVPLIKGTRGVMTFVVGTEVPSLNSGWVLLGKTYREVWADPEKLALYNALFPPDAAGKPRPFGFFAGADDQMLGVGSK
jgi:hypothetical protein